MTWRVIDPRKSLATGDVVEQTIDVKLSSFLDIFTPDSLINHLMGMLAKNKALMSRTITSRINGTIEILSGRLRTIQSGKTYQLIIRYKVVKASPLLPLAIASLLINPSVWVIIGVVVIGTLLYLTIRETRKLIKEFPELKLPVLIGVSALSFLLLKSVLGGILPKRRSTPRR